MTLFFFMNSGHFPSLPLELISFFVRTRLIGLRRYYFPDLMAVEATFEDNDDEDGKCMIHRRERKNRQQQQTERSGEDIIE